MFQWREFPLTEFKKVKQCGLDNTLNIFPRHTEHNTILTSTTGNSTRY